MNKMKMYWQIKGENQKISDENIAKMLKISGKNIRRWKKKFGEIQDAENFMNRDNIGHEILVSFFMFHAFLIYYFFVKGSIFFVFFVFYFSKYPEADPQVCIFYFTEYLL